MNEFNSKTILICDTQPVAIEGVRGVLSRCADLRFAGAVASLEAAFELSRGLNPACVVIDKSFGITAIADWLLRFRASGARSAPVIWGLGINESEALRFLQSGARGVIRRTAEPEVMLTCLRSVTGGNTWLEEGIFAETERPHNARRSQLTPRESEVAELVEKGMRNRDIANSLGIQTGTVKIHLKHIFEKTGVRGRYGLALSGIRDRNSVSPAPVC